MANLSERVRFTVPADVKARWQKEATERGVSLSALLRKASDELLFCHEIDVFEAQLEFKRLGATIQ